jgi:LysM repeat protein
MTRSPARLFAPLALVACAVAILVIVNHTTRSSDSTSGTTATGTTATTTAKQPAKRKQRRFYVVKQGDVLSQIAVKTGVPLDTLQQLNPTVDAQSLHAGQKLKLAP